MKNKLLNSLILAALTVPGAALAADVAPAPAPAPEYAITGNVGFTSDYVFNGISQSFRSPALQGGFDYTHTSGVYLGTWASNISGNQYTNASLEWDIYGGYNGKVNDDLGYNVGLMSVIYPGGKAYNTTPNNYKKWNTTEAIAGATWKGLNVKYTHTLTDWYGINTSGFTPVMWAAGDTASSGATGATTADAAGGSKGSGYLEANYTLGIAEGSSITVHAGHQKIRNFSKLSYTDYKLAVNKTYAGFNVGLAFTTTNATDNTLYHVVGITGDDKKLSGSILALSAGRSF
jgi:uncharacterized protein (TIGR02001 family)